MISIHCRILRLAAHGDETYQTNPIVIITIIYIMKSFMFAHMRKVLEKPMYFVIVMSDEH